MNNLTMWNLIIGFISATFILPIIQQPKWTVKFRTYVTFFYSIIVAFGSTFFSGDFSVKNLIGSILTVLVSAVAVYHGFAKGSDIAPKIEAATSGTSVESPTKES